MNCRNCNRAIRPDPDNEWVHHDGDLGCGLPFEGAESYAEPGAPAAGIVKTRPFAGTEWRIEFAGAPEPLIGQTGDEFLPDVVMVLHYEHGHWSAGEGSHTQVHALGEVVGLEKPLRGTSGRYWASDSLRPEQRFTAMPGWLRDLVTTHTGLDLSAKAKAGAA